ncbi:hypothetical protein [Methanolobus chelungpuianus]|uniref:hypothetical protein n=1 Tax=Methanolobus chelungpuianus TaxID=502115 RepID=UPI00211396CB|nr:hypothetical protein [Methanolobus chelungpuianus]
MADEHSKDIRDLREVFDSLSGKEKLDVLELQDIAEDGFQAQGYLPSGAQACKTLTDGK